MRRPWATIKSSFDLRQASDVASPAGYLLLFVFSLLSYYLVLRTKPGDILLVMLLDMVLKTVMGAPISRRASKSLLAGIKSIAGRNAEVTTIKAMGEEDMAALLEHAITFPERRARIFFWLSYPLSVPAYVLVYHLSLGDANPLFFGLKVFLLSSIFFAYFAGMEFFEAKRLIASRLSEAARQVDFGGAIRRLSREGRLPVAREGFRYEIMSLGGILFAMTACLSVIMGEARAFGEVVAVEIGTVFTIGSLSALRIWFLARSVTIDGLKELHTAVNAYRPGGVGGFYLPPHPDVSICEVGIAFDELVGRAGRYETELEASVAWAMERERLDLAGEMAGLLVHDLGGPLLTIASYLSMAEPGYWGAGGEQGMATSSAVRNVPKERVEQLRIRAEESLEVAIGMVSSLRSFLKERDHDEVEQAPPENCADLGQQISRALRVLAERYGDTFVKARIVVDPSLKGLMVAAEDIEVLHVALNLIGNGLAEIEKMGQENGRIEISRLDEKDGLVFVAFSDNGGGLDQMGFMRMTATLPSELSFAAAAKSPRGLGLRLTKRLLERRGGMLELVPPKDGTGATLVVGLPLASKERSTRSR